MNTIKGTPSSESGGRAVLDEAMRIASDELELGAELQPLVVTKGWDDCEVERFPQGLEQARARMNELLATAPASGHCAIAHVADAGHGPTAIVVELGRIGGHDVEVFVQRFRPRRGLLRRFKLIGKLSRAPESAGRFAATSPDTDDGNDET